MSNKSKIDNTKKGKIQTTDTQDQSKAQKKNQPQHKTQETKSDPLTTNPSVSYLKKEQTQPESTQPSLLNPNFPALNNPDPTKIGTQPDNTKVQEKIQNVQAISQPSSTSPAPGIFKFPATPVSTNTSSLPQDQTSFPEATFQSPSFSIPLQTTPNLFGSNPTNSLPPETQKNIFNRSVLPQESSANLSSSLRVPGELEHPTYITHRSVNEVLYDLEARTKVNTAAIGSIQNITKNEQLKLADVEKTKIPGLMKNIQEINTFFHNIQDSKNPVLTTQNIKDLHSLLEQLKQSATVLSNITNGTNPLEAKSIKGLADDRDRITELETTIIQIPQENVEGLLDRLAEIEKNLGYYLEQENVKNLIEDLNRIEKFIQGLENAIYDIVKINNPVLKIENIKSLPQAIKDINSLKEDVKDLKNAQQAIKQRTTVIFGMFTIMMIINIFHYMNMYVVGNLGKQG